MVDDAAAASISIVAAGGEIVQPVDSDAPVIFAHFRDPAGNVLGIYQEMLPKMSPVKTACSTPAIP
jgi:predicted enzyme related to lactoylglutathione lyase